MNNSLINDRKIRNNNIWIIIADDWELRGDGSGDVIALQYENALKLMELFESLKINMTFNIEVMQQISFERYSSVYLSIKKYKEYWKKTISIMLDRGFDVQLHIHPQWFTANYDGEYWRLDKRWNISDYTEEQIEFFIKNSLDYISENFDGLKPISFRGGAWGVWPSGVLFPILEKYGIKIDISMVNGLFSNSENMNLDYRDLESPYLPYYPDYNDVRKISKKITEIIEIPTQSFKRDWKFKIKKAYLKFLSTDIKGSKDKIISNRSKNFGLNENIKKIKKDYIIMDLANLDLSALKIGFDILIKRALISDFKGSVITPLVLESHTKDLNNYQLSSIKKSIEYVLNKYGSIVKFSTISEIYKNINLIKPIIKKDKL